MRLYPRNETTAVDHAGLGRFEPAEDGGFDFPGPLAEELHSTHIGGRQAWEDSIERHNRLLREEAARRADPRTLLDAVEKLIAQGHAAGASEAKAAPPAKPDPDKDTAKPATARQPRPKTTIGK